MAGSAAASPGRPARSKPRPSLFASCSSASPLKTTASFHSTTASLRRGVGASVRPHHAHLGSARHGALLGSTRHGALGSLRHGAGAGAGGGPLVSRKAGQGLRTRTRTLARNIWQKLQGASGPRGPPGQYGGVQSRVQRGMEPEWEQHLEVALEGGRVDEQGEYVNDQTAFSALRVELWEYRRFAANAFLGEYTAPFSTLLDGTPLLVEEAELEDPEDAGEGRLEGTLSLEIRLMT
eukprot:3821733-Rhodomonas_salina.1